MNEYKVLTFKDGKEQSHSIYADSARLAIESLLGPVKTFTYSNPVYIGQSADGTRFRVRLLVSVISYKDVREIKKSKRYWSR